MDGEMNEDDKCNDEICYTIFGITDKYKIVND